MEVDVLKRVEKLQSELRRWKVVTSLLLIAITTLVIAGAQFPDRHFVQQLPADKLMAREFTIVGSDGKPYGRFYTKDDHPTLEFYDSEGNVIWSARPIGGLTPVAGH